MADPSWPLQQAIYAALSSGLSIDVYDDAPQGVTRPYCFVGDDDLETDSSKDDDEEAWIATCEMEVIDDTHRGRKVIKEAFAEIREILHNKPLAVAGFVVNWVLYQSSSTDRSEDGLTYRGVVTYQIRIQEPQA